MAVMRTANPTLNKRIFRNYSVGTAESMTIQGSVNKTAVLVLLALIAAYFTWHKFMITKNLQTIQPFMWIGVIGGFFIALITIFNPRLLAKIRSNK